MRERRGWGTILLWGLGGSALPTLSLEGLRWLMGAPFAWNGLALRWGWVTGILIVAMLTRPYLLRKGLFSWPGLLWLGPGLVMVLVYGLKATTWSAWALVGLAYLLLLGLETILSATRPWFRRWSWRLLLALIAGALPVALSQIESHFADEEFFVALEALALALFWLLLVGVYRFTVRSVPLYIHWRAPLKRRLAGGLLAFLAFGGLNGTVWAYRHSFYPLAVPTYPGISQESPFLCGQVAPDSQTYDGQDVFVRLLGRVEANPYKGPPEYGMLALGAGEQRWAKAFREALLQEVVAGRYTGPANSVKSVQFEAALRAYYFPRVRERFPALFSEAEIAQVKAWFAAINRRALTVEWVDLMYSLAFSKWSEGPYENQENGAGLLAMLETGDLADPALSAANRDYLARNQRGWAQRFRVTDDAIGYQPEWIYNAYFQTLYTGEFPDEKARLSFEWLLLQALPDAASLRYNHPGKGTMAGIAYLGATFFHDPRYLWLAGRAVTELEQREGYLFAQPGVEEPVLLEGHSPTEGSCLLFGDSGLPNQVGPLAPDKIIFRDGWGQDATYLLVNLRFTGWHRYKGTGTVTLLYQEGALAYDVLDGQPFSWLPVGRSLFRDKRIPRENLNGLVVAKTGMAATLYGLTGVGGPWAQDPPYYAEVVAFETGETLDWAHIRLTGWRGWQQDRWIYFYHGGGPVVVADEAQGPPQANAALLWHWVDGERVGDNRFQLRTENKASEIVVATESNESRLTFGNGSGLDMSVSGQNRLHTVMVFLSGEGIGAEVKLDQGKVRIELNGQVILSPLLWR